MKICVVTRTYPKGDDHRGAFVQARVDLYRRMGHEVNVWAQSSEDAHGTFDDYDVAAIHTPLPDWGIRLGRHFLAVDVPVVAYVHGSEGISVPWRWTGIKYQLGALKHKEERLRFLNDCDAVVTESKWMRDTAMQSYFGSSLRPDDYGNNANFRVIPNPVDPELFRLSGSQSRRGVSIRGDHPKYGTDLLDGAGVDVLEPGYRRIHLPAVLSEYGFFVAPSRMEGQGLMACEAAATGMPVVSTKVGGIPEFLSSQHHSQHHILVDKPDALDLRNAIEVMRQLVPEPMDMRAEIRDSILSRCGPAVTVEKDIELFKGLIARRS